MVLNFPSNYKWFISETVSCLRSQWWSLLEFQALPPVAGFLSTILFLNLWFSSLGWNTTFGLTGLSWIKIPCVIKDKKITTGKYWHHWRQWLKSVRKVCFWLNIEVWQVFCTLVWWKQNKRETLPRSNLFQLLKPLVWTNKAIPT